MDVLIFFIFLLACNFAASVNYDGYKIYGVKLRTENECFNLNKISQWIDFDNLHIPHALNSSAHIMVEPDLQFQFEESLLRYKLNYSTLVHDVGRSLHENCKNKFGRRIPNSSSNVSRIDFNHFHRSSEINKYLDELAANYPKNVIVSQVGLSYEGRPIKTIRISSGVRTSTKKVIFVDAGIHAREWIAPSTALYIIYQLVENMKENEVFLKSYDWLILPLVNPDGYEYSHTTNRMWRKTRSKYGSQCYGTDCNRNFAYFWGAAGASKNSCSDTYAGPMPFSEPEAKIVRDLLVALKGVGKFYLTLHSYGRFLLYPLGFPRRRASNYKNLDAVAAAGANAIYTATRKRYAYGSSQNILYEASGSSDDFAYARANFPISITMELPPGGTGFDPKPSEIKGFVEEAWIGIKAMALAVVERY